MLQELHIARTTEPCPKCIYNFCHRPQLCDDPPVHPLKLGYTFALFTLPCFMIDRRTNWWVHSDRYASWKKIPPLPAWCQDRWTLQNSIFYELCSDFMAPKIRYELYLNFLSSQPFLLNHTLISCPTNWCILCITGQWRPIDLSPSGVSAADKDFIHKFHNVTTKNEHGVVISGARPPGSCPPNRSMFISIVH